MVTKEEYAQLSLYVYNVIGRLDNRPETPSSDWKVREYHPDDAIGFSYGIFQNTATGEVVVAYTGTNEKKVADFLLANLSAGVGLSSLQVNEAARVAARVIDTYGANHVTFTGHSLGGGLASIMGVWFARPATLFDTAPFELTARNPLAVESARNWITLTTGLSNAALNSFEVLGNFSQREAGVTSYYTSEEALQLLRMALPTVAGTELRIEFGVDNMHTRRIDLHSQALLTAGLMSDGFREATIAVQRSIPLMLDGDLYAYDAASSSKRNFLIDLIRSEQQLPANGKLTHFAADLNKLGTNIAGLNQAAQSTLIAQGIEWYYWQGTDYVGQELFVSNGAQPGLLQYEPIPSSTIPGGKSKADPWVSQWINGIANWHGALGVGTTYEQWNVSGSAAAVTAQARNPDKRQIYIGNIGADTLFGGNKNDVILAGDGADILVGGGGNDQIAGGGGFDSYGFAGNFGNDTVIDSDGSGQIVIDGTVALTGGKRQSATVWRSDDDKYEFHFAGNLASGERGMLRIFRTGVIDQFNSIVVRNWRPGELNITLAPDKAALSAPPAGDPIRDLTLTAESHGPVVTSEAGVALYNWGADASTWVAEPGFADVTGYSNSEYGASLSKFDNLMASTGAGNGLFDGYMGHDTVDAGAGNDLLIGGPGVNVLKAGAGDDIVTVLAAASFGGPLRSGPQDQWSAPAVNCFATLHALDNNAGDTACAELKEWQDADQDGNSQGSEPLNLAGRAITGIAHGTHETFTNNGVSQQITAQTPAMSVRHRRGRCRGRPRSGGGVSESKRHHPIVEWSLFATENILFSGKQLQTLARHSRVPSAFNLRSPQ